MTFFHKGKPIKNVSFLGFGKSNAAVYEYLKANYPELEFTVRAIGRPCVLPKGVRVLGDDEPYHALPCDVIFVSPSVRRDKYNLDAPILSSDAELFFEKNRREVFAVTGSDGKSTTASISAKLLGTCAIGNIGIPFVKALGYSDSSDALPLVAELSSFQLMNFAPKSRRAVITNITPNHLDWHSSYEEYIESKKNVLKNTQEPILFLGGNESFDILKKHRPYALASLILSEEEIKKHKAELYVYVKDGAICTNGEKLLDLSDISRKEEYNIKNFLSAIALTHGFFDTDTLIRTAKEFSGLPHRLELVGEAFGVKFFNSSIDSSPQRTLETLTSLKNPYVLIMGGRTKMDNFEILEDVIERTAAALVLTGENAREISEKLASISIPICFEADFDAAVERGFYLAKNKGSVVLSPASVSYDAFSNFEERGDAFRRVAEKIKLRGL